METLTFLVILGWSYFVTHNVEKETIYKNCYQGDKIVCGQPVCEQPKPAEPAASVEAPKE